jgi:hypothetical protein
MAASVVRRLKFLPKSSKVGWGKLKLAGNLWPNFGRTLLKVAKIPPQTSIFLYSVLPLLRIRKFYPWEGNCSNFWAQNLIFAKK